MKPKQRMQIWQILQKRPLSSQRHRQQQHQVDKQIEPVFTLHTCCSGLPGLRWPVVLMCSAPQKACY